MAFILQPWQLLIWMLVGWVQRQQEAEQAYNRTEIRILLELLGKRRLLLNDDQRRRSAVHGKVLGRNRLGEVAAIFTPDTILRWHRQLVAEK
jgi:hypothetical protein